MSFSKSIPDLHSISDSEAQELCGELRSALITTVAHTGGHLASNLGVVELTVAIHRVFDTGTDRLVFDVGHQCYTHKILTGRGAVIDTLRSFGGISGYPKPCESPHDAFVAGHASNSVSVALGMARARTLLEKNYSVLALIGDGALTGGLAYEGLSDAGESGEPLIIILNDNGMSITKNVGGVAQYLAHQRLKPQYIRFRAAYRKLANILPFGHHLYRFTHKVKTAIKSALLPCSMFEDMGFLYLGPVSGHDISGLTRLLRYAKELKAPVLLHIRTTKGYGYQPSVENPDFYHGVSPFAEETGLALKPSKPGFSDAFGEAVCRLALGDRRICAVTAAMQTGTGLEQFSKKFPTRFFDVGIAEGHAVTMAAGMAKQGIIPVFAVYSSFLQRGYDMLIHDVAIQGLHVVFAIDRAGLVGEDGETHHGIFDVAYLHTVPGMTVYCPASFDELGIMLSEAVYKVPGPVAVRYPRGGEGAYTGASTKKALVLRGGNDITMVGYGTLINNIMAAAEKLEAEDIHAEVIKLGTVQPIDWDTLRASLAKTRRLLVAEDSVAMGSVGERIAAWLSQNLIRLDSVTLCSCGSGFVTHGTVPQLCRLKGLDAESLRRRVMEVCSRDE